MADEQDQFSSCDVCGRTILRGERIYDYVTPRGDRMRVCALCRSQAEESGWIPAEHAAAFAHAPQPRRQRTRALRQRLERAASRARANLPSISVETEEPPAPAPEPEPEPAAAPAPPRVKQARTPDRVIQRAVETFNRSHMPRRIAGLIRSLGQPRVAIRPAPNDWSALVTVAWELSWYQWEVTVEDDRSGVEEIAKGDELSEIEDGLGGWNASVGEDGQLRLGT